MHRPAFSLLFVSLALPASLAAQTAFAFTRHAGGPGNYTHAAKGDVDGDGDIDLVVSHEYSLVLRLNDGNGRLLNAPPANLVVAPATQLDCHALGLADIDGDGDLDLLVTNEDDVPNLVFRNNGSGVFADVSATALPPNALSTHSHVLGDFDGDGDVDWLVSDGDEFGSTGCIFYENVGAGVFVDGTATHIGAGFANLGDLCPPAAADLDGDGDLEVVANGRVWPNLAGVLSPTGQQLTGGYPHWLADVDGDGDFDCFANAGRVLWRNNGNATFVNVTASAFPSTPTSSYACFDVDADGDADLMGPNGMWLNDGTGAFTWFASASPYGSPFILDLLPADYDGDGDVELPGMPNMLRHVEAPQPAVRGAAYSVRLHSRVNAPSLAALFFATAGGATPLGPFGTLRLDSSAMIVGVHWPTLTTPSTFVWTMPTNPALAGTQLHFQAIVDDPLNGFVVSNTFFDVLQ